MMIDLLNYSYTILTLNHATVECIRILYLAIIKKLLKMPKLPFKGKSFIYIL